MWSQITYITSVIGISYITLFGRRRTIVCCDSWSQLTEVSVLVINPCYLRYLGRSRLLWPLVHSSLISRSAEATVCCDLWPQHTEASLLVIVPCYFTIPGLQQAAVSQGHSSLVSRPLVATVCCEIWPQHTEFSLLIPLCSLVSNRNKFLWNSVYLWKLWLHRQEHLWFIKSMEINILLICY